MDFRACSGIMELAPFRKISSIARRDCDPERRPQNHPQARETNMPNRRSFLTAAGTTVLAAQTDLLRFASSLFAAEADTAARPKVMVLFFQRKTGGGLTYPTATTEQLKQITELFVKTLKDGATQFGVELDVRTEPVTDVAASLAEIKKTAPDGLLVIANELWQRDPINQLVEKRGGIPTIVYSNVTAFIPDYRRWAKSPQTFVAATEDVGYLATAVRMFRTHWDMKKLKLLSCPTKDYAVEYGRTADSDELRAIADFWIKNATKVVEPTKDQVLAAVKYYVTMRRLLKKTGCNGVTVTGPLCVGARPPKANPACLAVSRLLDDGVPAACQKDVDSAKCMRLMFSLVGRPGFMGNVAADTVENTLLITHCTSALKLEGLTEKYRAPYMLRDFHAMGGASVMAAWPVDKEVTVVDFLDETTVSVGEGRIVANSDKVAQPPCGGCRTSVDIAVEGVRDILAVDASRTLHHYVVLGRFARNIVNYCKLAGLKAVDLTAKSRLA